MPVGTNSLIGAPSLEKDALFAESGSTPYTLGQIVQGFDPYWGWLEMIYVKFASASTLVDTGRLVTIDSTFTIADNANSANTARAVYVVGHRFPSSAAVGASNPLYGWVVRAAGKFPVQASAAYTAGPTYFAAAGTVTSTLTAGKQVIGMNGLIGSAGTITVQAQTVNGSPLVRVASKAGLYGNATVSGTGIPASTEITTLDTGDNLTILVNNNATATGTITMTVTNTGFAICQFNSPTTQGNTT